MKLELLNVLCCAFAILGIASALANLVPMAAISVLACAACLLALERLRGPGPAKIDGDALRFVNNILSNYSCSASTVSIVQKSLNSEFSFYKAMKRAIAEYHLSSDAPRAFSRLASTRSYILSAATAAIVDRLEYGTALKAPLAELKRHALRRKRNTTQGVVASAGALSIARLGSMLFFPLFAGISINILLLTSEMQGVSAQGVSALVLVFAFYILYTNFLNFKYSLKESVESRIRKALFSGAAAMVAFRLAMLLSVSML